MAWGEERPSPHMLPWLELDRLRKEVDKLRAEKAEVEHELANAYQDWQLELDQKQYIIQTLLDEIDELRERLNDATHQ